MQKLRVYGLSMKFYRQILALKFPRHLSSQIRRASSSVVENIAEGSARRTKLDQRRFYVIAYSSACESKSILEMAEITDIGVLDCADHLCASLYRLSHSSV